MEDKLEHDRLERVAKEFIEEANILAERLRVNKVRSLNIMNTSTKEKLYNDIAFVSAQVCNKEAGIITFIDDKFAFIKANSNGACGIEPRENSFCNITIETPDQPLVVEDARKDDRLVSNPKVLAGDVIFYAGIPMVCDGQAIGALRVVDKQPSKITDTQLEALKKLADIVATLVAK